MLQSSLLTYWPPEWMDEVHSEALSWGYRYKIPLLEGKETGSESLSLQRVRARSQACPNLGPGLTEL